nr:uncharacterized protein LOC105885499 isoform X3 [Microcebus murinus]
MRDTGEECPSSGSEDLGKGRAAGRDQPRSGTQTGSSGSRTLGEVQPLEGGRDSGLAVAHLLARRGRDRIVARESEPEPGAPEVSNLVNARGGATRCQSQPRGRGHANQPRLRAPPPRAAAATSKNSPRRPWPGPRPSPANRSLPDSAQTLRAWPAPALPGPRGRGLRAAREGGGGGCAPAWGERGWGVAASVPPAGVRLQVWLGPGFPLPTTVSRGARVSLNLCPGTPPESANRKKLTVPGAEMRNQLEEGLPQDLWEAGLRWSGDGPDRLRIALRRFPEPGRAPRDSASAPGASGRFQAGQKRHAAPSRSHLVPTASPGKERER